MGNSQKQKYNNIYKMKEFAFNLPDYKITNNKQVKDKRILVLGVGTGRDVRYLVKNNDVYGIDFSSQALKIAKSFGIKVRRSNLDQPLEFKSKAFDIIVAKDILEHLESPLFLAKEIRRVLKDDGYAVINVPNHFFLPFRIRILFGGNMIWRSLGHDHTKLFNEWNYMHKVFFTWGGFKSFIKLSGFKISKTFWDFGTLAHYNQPEMVFKYLQQKLGKDGKLLLFFGKLSWSVFNFFFPKKLRLLLVSLRPGLLCSSFYVWVKPEIRK